MNEEHTRYDSDSSIQTTPHVLVKYPQRVRSIRTCTPRIRKQTMIFVEQLQAADTKELDWAINEEEEKADGPSTQSNGPWDNSKRLAKFRCETTKRDGVRLTGQSD